MTSQRACSRYAVEREPRCELAGRQFRGVGRRLRALQLRPQDGPRAARRHRFGADDLSVLRIERAVDVRHWRGVVRAALRAGTRRLLKHGYWQTVASSRTLSNRYTPSKECATRSNVNCLPTMPATSSWGALQVTDFHVV